MTNAERNRRKKLQRYLRSTGRTGRVSGQEAQALVDRITELNKRGMTYTAMCQQTGVPLSSLHYVIRTGPPRMLRTTYDKLSRLRFEQSGERGALRPALATQRRIQALRAAGYTQTFLCGELGLSEEGVYNLAHSVAEFVRLETELAVTTVYQKFEMVNPKDLGISASGIAFAKTMAGKHKWAPPSCWDTDTISDPEAIPEWTGACGTQAGCRLHTKYGIPRCAPCQAADRARRQELKEKA